MKKFLKSRIFVAIITAIICISGAVIAEVQFQADEVGYKNTTVDKALDDLYNRADNSLKLCDFIDGTYGSKGNVGAKYECDLGDGETRNFYLLTINNDNTVDMIMDRNITDIDETTKLTFDDANNYFVSGIGIKYKNKWKNVVNVKLPSLYQISMAINYSNYNNGLGYWCFGNKQAQDPCDPQTNIPYVWLYDYTTGCSGCNNSLTSGINYGYWTSSVYNNDTRQGWCVHRFGGMHLQMKNELYHGVRPVITVLKSSLSD